MKTLQTAITHVGSVTKLAGILGVSTQAVCFWRDGKRQMPAERCIEIEKATQRKVACEDLRPDVDWAYLRTTVAQMPQSATGPTPIAQEASHGA